MRFERSLVLRVHSIVPAAMHVFYLSKSLPINLRLQRHLGLDCFFQSLIYLLIVFLSVRVGEAPSANDAAEREREVKHDM